MNKNLIIILIFFAGIFIACSEYDYVKPEIIKFTADPVSISAGDTVFFHIEYAGSSAVIWFGVPKKSDYDAYIQQTTNLIDSTKKNTVPQANRGAIVEETDFFNIYAKTGKYKAVLVVNSISNSGKNEESVIDSISINVTP